MNVLFISISSLPHVSEHSISLDLIHEFVRNGHDVYIVCALERIENESTYIAEEAGCKILRVRIGNNKKASIFEKGLTTVLLPWKYISAIKEHYSNVRFDLVLYPTPPVTQVTTVKYIKKRDGAISYLLLKDIFPQNAVDIGMMNKYGIKGLPYKYFRHVEKGLYKASDYIGCMSEANVKYIIKHNPEIDPKKVEICPNSIEVVDKSLDQENRIIIRKQYSIPIDKKVFVYGGNLGKPQGISHLISCLEKCKYLEDAYFLIIGDGTEYKLLEDYIINSSQENTRLMKRLPKEEYDNLVAACDVGLIFLDHRFTIPNFPSRLLSYLQAKLPVLAVTDPHTDIGKVLVNGGFGWWCESDNSEEFYSIVSKCTISETRNMGIVGFDFLRENFNVTEAYQTITRRLKL